MIHYGDITKISGYDVPIVDCVVGGSPCQNFSVAGNREGLDGDESALFVEQLRVIKEMRDKDARSGRTGEFIRPRYMVWENVPGAFSSNKGQDFRKVLEETAKIVDKDAVIPMPPKDKWTTSGCIVGDGWSIAWRVLDAQFWGVPQRRRRIALVADFGGGCAQEILFERKSLRRHSEESRTERKGITEDAQGSIGVYDRDGKNKCMSFHLLQDVITSDKISPCITSGNPISGQASVGVCIEEAVAYSIENHPSDGRMNIDESGKVQTLTSRIGTGGGNGPMVMVEGLDCYNQQMTGGKTTCLRSKSADTDHIPCVVMDRSAFNQGENAKYNIGIDENGVAFSHIAKGPGAVAYGFYPQMKAESICWLEDKANTLVVGTNPGFHNGVCYCLQGNQIDQADTSVCNGSGFKEGTSYTLNVRDRHAVCYKEPHYIVRRLTPLECERLQGFKDGWTDIGEYTDNKGKKKKTSDSARYKALGNSIALPPWKWVIKRLCSHYERDATMASLFDGIGGFPCLWEQINGKGSCLWASEIEDFPIAVTKLRIE